MESWNDGILDFQSTHYSIIPPLHSSSLHHSNPPLSPLHTHDLPESVHNLDQILLRVHDVVDGLVRHRRLVDHVGILAALDAGGRLDVIVDAEAPLGFVA